MRIRLLLHGDRTAVAALTFLMTLTSGWPAEAVQGPTRNQTVRLPGTDIVLRAGWQLVWTGDGRCAFSVPASWFVSADRRWAAPPHGGVFVSVSAFDTSWSAHLAAIKRAMQTSTVREDSSTRFWVERTDGRRIQQHVSVGNGTGVCSADIEAQSAADATDVLRNIASSIRVAHDGDNRFTKP